MSRVAITGATGFVGRRLLGRLAGSEHQAIAFVRAGTGAAVGAQRSLPDLALLAKGEESVDLSDVNVLVHCAAITHSPKGLSSAEKVHLFAVNAGATEVLARKAAAAGVRRFILVSTVKVNGETTPYDAAFTADDVPAPFDDYAHSKLAAERELTAIAGQTGMESVIIRPPLIYGPGVRSNFNQLIRLSARGLPLPLGAVRNRRSMVYVENLADLIVVAIDHPQAAGQILMASDGADLSTTELIRKLARLQGAPDRLLPIPPFLLASALAFLGRKGIADRLLQSLRVDIGPTRDLLGWAPPFDVDEALRRTVAGPK